MHTAKVDLTLSPAGRHLAFSKDLLEVAHIFRRVGGKNAPWQRMAVNSRSPYLDAEEFAPGILLEYYVQHETQSGAPEARSHVVSTTIQADQGNQNPAPGYGDIPLGSQHEQTRITPLLPAVANDWASNGQGQ